ncbi:hypothetical protein [Niallia circulans]|uniref:hypothetical protein n=1 Tax=Niallia circulans TaxID=1397 RepID=UPI0026EC6A5A|nr:hypothetical protein [Niallia circulans]
MLEKKIMDGILSNYKAQMMWFTACQYRTIKQDYHSLSITGIKVRHMESYVEDMNKQFRFATQCEYEDEIMNQLKKFGETMISYDQMAEIIYKYVIQ